MAVKDILAIVLAASEDAGALRAAQAIADKAGAHVAAAFLTALPDEPLAYEPSVVAGVWAELLTRARADAHTEQEKVEALLSKVNIKVDMRVGEALSRDLGRIAAVHARYADLTVLTRPFGDAGDIRHDVVEGVLFHSGRPSLVVPPNWSGAGIGRRPLIAWDASREATRALSDASDLIEGAEEVLVLTIDARPKTFGHGDLPGANIAAHLERRGLKAQVLNIESAGKASAVILEQAQRFRADLVVMGGYGQARIREYIFGGATRDMLEKSTLPVLMSH